MKKDYEFVIKVIRNKENTRYHYPAIKNLISLFKLKWDIKKQNKSNTYEVYLHSLKDNLKKSFR